MRTILLYLIIIVLTVIIETPVCGQGISKSIYASYNLKNGYHLSIESSGKDSNAIVLEKDGKRTIVDEAETKLGLDALGSLYADFENYFVTASQTGVIPIKLEIVNKELGGVISWGQSPFYTDTAGGIILYDGYSSKSGNIILYNFKEGKRELYPAPTDTHCFCCFCWKLISISTSQFTIEYVNLKNENVKRTYKR